MFKFQPIRPQNCRSSRCNYSKPRNVSQVGIHYPTGVAVAAIDALMAATDVKVADVEHLIHRYPGRRGSKGARATMQLVDPGAQSPKETWLRLRLCGRGYSLLNAPQRKSRCGMNQQNGSLHISTWDGTTSWSPSSMTAINIGPTGGKTERTSHFSPLVGEA